MLHVFERLSLRYTFAQARELLCAAIAALDGRTLAGGLFGVERASDPLRSVRPWHIIWSGAQGEFAGEIAARIDGATRGAVLEVHGDFAPGVGAPIEAMSATALRTARDLLAAVSAEMDACYSETMRFA